MGCWATSPELMLVKCLTQGHLGSRRWSKLIKWLFKPVIFQSESHFHTDIRHHQWYALKTPSHNIRCIAHVSSLQRNELKTLLMSFLISLVYSWVIFQSLKQVFNWQLWPSTALWDTNLKFLSSIILCWSKSSFVRSWHFSQFAPKCQRGHLRTSQQVHWQSCSSGCR